MQGCRREGTPRPRVGFAGRDRVRNGVLPSGEGQLHEAQWVTSDLLTNRGVQSVGDLLDSLGDLGGDFAQTATG
jgi:hypothetical protein